MPARPPGTVWKRSNPFTAHCKRGKDREESDGRGSRSRGIEKVEAYAPRPLPSQETDLDAVLYARKSLDYSLGVNNEGIGFFPFPFRNISRPSFHDRPDYHGPGHGLVGGQEPHRCRSLPYLRARRPQGRAI